AGGCRLCMGVHKALRQAAGVTYGDLVELEIERDDRPRVLELPAELEEEFRADPALRARFDSLSFSRRRGLAAPISEAKRPETRAARLGGPSRLSAADQARRLRGADRTGWAR